MAEIMVPEEVVREFRIAGLPVSMEVVPSGHIHQSYKVQTDQAVYFLQKINHHVFRNVEGLMGNIQKATSHLSARWVGGPYETLDLVPVRQGSPYLEWKGEYWRMFRFKEGMQSHDVPASTAEVFDAARAFAAFSEGLKDLSADTFSESIPGFQSMSLRLNQLENAIRGQHDLKRELSDELAFVEKVSGKFLELEGLWHSGQLPTRICHNDTKFNNVLFDKENQAKCVVDLDTVMPGILHFDLGDGLRTTASLAAEDEPDLRNVVIERERNDAYLAGYLEGFGGEITSLEREWMPVSGAYMAFIMGIRFLADHFNGDVYYKTKFRGHNLNRSRCQLHLTDLFLRQAFESGT